MSKLTMKYGLLRSNYIRLCTKTAVLALILMTSKTMR